MGPLARRSECCDALGSVMDTALTRGCLAARGVFHRSYIRDARLIGCGERSGLIEHRDERIDDARVPLRAAVLQQLGTCGGPREGLSVGPVVRHGIVSVRD